MARPNKPKPALLTTNSTSTPCSGQRRGDLVAGVRLFEIAGNHDRGGPAFGRDFCGQRLQPVRASRHHRHAMAVGSKDTHQLGADPRRGTRNQRHPLSHDLLARR